MARASSPSPRRCCSRASPMSAATRARRCRTCSTCWSRPRTSSAELGVHVEACTNEASAAAMLGASINYPLRGAVTWKSIVGTNVAADALSNLASPGVTGGALIVVGEDYGEGASVIQERTHAFAHEILDVAARPAARPADDRAHGREGLRALRGDQHAGDAGAAHPRLPRARQFAAKDNRRAAHLAPRPDGRAAAVQLRPARASAGDLRAGEAEDRASACRRREPSSSSTSSTSIFAGDLADIGIIVQGGLYNALLRALQQLGLADAFGAARVPISCSTSSIRWCRKK